MSIVTLKDFIDTDLKVFSNLDNVRSIPSIIDGFKDSQRKAVYGLIQNGNSEIKVAQLGGYAANITHYEHGEGSMCGTIVGLAQRFPGANNVNLFEPIGQFGSILSSESSAHRYIFTKPSHHLRKYLRKEDDLIIQNRTDEEGSYEPINYFPILPMWILNGSVGVGTGHSCKILPRNPKKVMNLVKKMIEGKKITDEFINESLKPDFIGWKGKVESREDSQSNWLLHGVIEKINTTTLKVTELPFYDVDKFKSILIKLMDAGTIKDFESNSTEEGFNFEITVAREIGKKSEDELKKLFKLVVGFGENVTLWNVEGKLHRFETVYEALQQFVEFRKSKYTERKNALISKLSNDLEWLTAKSDFIVFWNTFDSPVPHKMSDSELRKHMLEIADEKYHDRLLHLPVRSLTLEKVNELIKECKTIEDEIEVISSTPEDKMYLKDLSEV